ncbi:hypothetical protein [Paenibacillus flagellatus]|uniref:Uncharacterized protein n=1 Tax=Paenibacillus flagellatus TaxID=2211139 RepID=A0A2V5KPB5_9BACL|nr:hypothetical protein [Paenibacillus flagellatus]PYI57290.1 hypothetical protein DLM86_02285 [Paenibacillus flagellatus]
MNRRTDTHETPTFNSVTEHYRTVMGVPSAKVDMKSMPRPLQLFGYGVAAVMAVCTAAFLAMYVSQFF